MTRTDSPRLARLIGLIALFVLIGTPMVAYLWETLNMLLSGHVDPGRLGVSVVVLALFAALLAFLARAVHALEGDRDARAGPTPPSDDLPSHTQPRRPQ